LFRAADEERRERIYELAWAAYADPEPAMRAAAEIRDRAFGPRITYSRKVFVPLTKLCRDTCGYCTFAHGPRPGEKAYLTPEEVLEIARTGAEAGCKEALFTLGDKPEKRYPEAIEELGEMGFATTIEYLAHCCGLVLEKTGLLPHANPGVLSGDEVLVLRRVSVSQGTMLEQATDRLLGPNLAHWASPDKVPAKRLGTMDEAGRLRVPFTTGILIGIGETVEERVDTLLEIRKVHERHGNVQECIVQKFRAKPGTRMAGRAEPTGDEMLATIALARLLLPQEVTIQAPPNLADSGGNGTPPTPATTTPASTTGAASRPTTSTPSAPGRTSKSYRRPRRLKATCLWNASRCTRPTPATPRRGSTSACAPASGQPRTPRDSPGQRTGLRAPRRLCRQERWTKSAVVVRPRHARSSRGRWRLPVSGTCGRKR
jgi:7,8-didemethyl-8-hydroxy-5-deazariboflavin synthase CofG subunit